eukprot:m.197703 g.197703  ORF g.197703 m.197703 type:complete len:332 (-) comp18724_c0_seq4:264-1259(-)
MEADYGVLVSNSMHKHTFQTGRAQCSMPADDGAASVSFDKLHSKRHRHAYHDMSYLDDDDDYCERDTAAKRLAVDLSQFSLRDTRNSVCERTRLVGYAPSSASMPLADDVSMQGDYHTEINSADVVVQRGTDNPYSRRMSTNKSQRTATHVLVPMDAAVLESDYDGDDENDTEAGKSIRGVQEHEVIQEFLVCPRDLLQRKHDSRCATPCLEIVPYQPPRVALHELAKAVRERECVRSKRRHSYAAKPSSPLVPALGRGVHPPRQQHVGRPPRHRRERVAFAMDVNPHHPTVGPDSWSGMSSGPNTESSDLPFVSRGHSEQEENAMQDDEW